MTPLCELALKHGTDKGGNHYLAGDTCHNYTEMYYALLNENKESAKQVLEVGVNYGPSLRMWEDFFPNAHIWGLDCNADCLQYTGGRRTVLLADQGNAQSLLSAVAAIQSLATPFPGFDLIVDDGSHEEGHIVLTANTLIPTLSPTGLYIVEDIEFDCDPERYMRQIKFPGIPVNVGVGLGKAHCAPWCPRCHGKEGEKLLVFSRDDNEQ